MEIKTILHITLAQVNLFWENPEKNREYLEVQIKQLKGISDLVILPETFTTGFSVRASDMAESMDGPTIRWLLALSRESGLAIGGSLLIKENNFCYNRFVFVTPGGEISVYDKRHLFSIGGESDVFQPGTQRTIIGYSGWKIALYICYDIRFPVWCRNINDTDLMIFTANWPSGRSNVWDLLLKARAVENQVYVAGVNRVGIDGENISYSGGSQLVNARGEVLKEVNSTHEGMITHEISLTDLNEFREKFPVAKDADRFLIA